MKRAGWGFLFLLLFLTGCGAGNAESVWLPVRTEETVKSMESEQEEETVQKKLTLMVDGTVVPVIWEDNPSVAELTEQAAQKAMEIEMRMYGGWEQVGFLAHSISSNDVQLTADNGDIMLYSGNQIVLFYGGNTWAYTKLGHIDLTGEEVTNLLSRGAVRITLAVQ